MSYGNSRGLIWVENQGKENLFRHRLVRVEAKITWQFYTSGEIV